MATAVKDLIDIVREIALRDGNLLTDSELLRAYIERRDQPSLSVLVNRHSGMIWGVCRRMLGVGQDAEDAFQATFLVLVKKATSIRDPERVANWLYGVAQQTAMRMRALRAKRGNRERQVEKMPDRSESSPPIWDDIAPLIDEELSRLPEKYRTLIVLCDLEEKPRSVVARQLGCPEGTVAGRLARARKMLAQRLVRRGVPTTAGVLATALAAQSASAAPASLVASTIQTAITGTGSATAVALANGVIQAMFFKKLQFAVVVLSTVTVFVLGGFLTYTAATTTLNAPVPDNQPIVAPDRKTDEPKPGDPKLPAKIQMTASAPVFRFPDPVDLPDFKYWEVKVQYKNDSDKEVILYPYIKLDVFDAANKPVDFDVRIGIGFRPERWPYNSEKEFLVIPPGKTRDVVVNLGDNRDFLGTLGWSFKKPGTYKVVLTYQHNRKKFAEDHFPKLLGSDEEDEFASRPERVWNRAVEMTKSVTVELKIGK